MSGFWPENRGRTGVLAWLTQRVPRTVPLSLRATESDERPDGNEICQHDRSLRSRLGNRSFPSRDREGAVLCIGREPTERRP